MSSNSIVSYHPTAGLSYDPTESIYWDADALRAETTRVFEVCHGCRMCFKFCDSFPNLFEFIEKTEGEDVRKLTGEQIDAVMGDCFQCKLCEVQCPYTPRENHEFQLDFPKLVHRWSAQRHRRVGAGLRERILGDPDQAGRIARWLPSVANRLNRSSLHRWFGEKLLGIHRDARLPNWAPTSFETWARGAGRVRPAEDGIEIVLFPTCTVQNHEPDIGRDTLEVLDRNGASSACTEGLACCGMPAWEHGDLPAVTRQAAATLDVLMPYVARGAKVLVLQPSCAMMLRREWPTMLDGPDRQRAKRLAEAVVEPGEWLWSIRKEARFNTDFKTGPGETVHYHVPCHLRAQAVGFRSRELLKKLPGVTSVPAVTECCGHDGTYAMKVESHDASARIGQRAFDGMKEGNSEVWVTDCALAGLQFEQHAGRRALHPMTVLARSYRGESFAPLRKP